MTDTNTSATWRERIGEGQLRIWKRILLIVAALTAVSWWMHRPDERTRQLNDVLETKASAHLKTYPYEFRVLRVEGKTAVLSTPRNFDVPAFKMLGALYPDINVKNPNDPAFIAKEQALAAAQSEAGELIRSQPGIEGIRWELDTHWLEAHGIPVPESAYPRRR